MNTFIRVFFFGNLYLGVCAVALCIETSLLLNISLNIFPFYLIIFFCTCIYYTMIYVRSVGAINYNERTTWYRNNLLIIKKFLKTSIILTVAFLFFLVWKNLSAIFSLSLFQYLLIVIILLVAGWYTFSSHFFRIKNIRQTGWIKPFVVGLTWAGWVTVYPLLVWSIQRRHSINNYFIPLLLLWLQDFLFFSINAVLFDIKDYRIDFQNHLKTYPVILGVRNTFRFIIVPLTILNLLVFFLFQWQQNYSAIQTVIQLIPYVLLIVIMINHRAQRGLLYYLAAVDGLVFAKAVCGITSILFLKKP